MKNEAELAGVLAHEIIHVTEKHTVNAIQKSDGVQVGVRRSWRGRGLAGSLVTKLADAAYSNILNNKFSRNDEVEADEKGVQLANKVGYAPTGLAGALTKLTDRNKDAKEPNGLFASHPMMKDRLANLDKTIREKKLTATATVEARYAKNITFDAKPATALATVAEGSRGLAGGSEEKKPAEGEKPAEGRQRKKSLRRAVGCLASSSRAADRRRSSRRPWPRPALEGSTPTATPSAAPTRSACR